MRKRWAVVVLALPLLLPRPVSGAQQAMRFTASRPSGPVTGGAGEPTLGVDPRTGAVLVQARNLTFRVDSRWTDVTAPSLRGMPSVDPILETDRTTGRTFVSHLLFACGVMAYTDDAGTSWTPVPVGCGAGAMFDHQTVGAGAGSVYYCAHDLVTARCGRSADGGDTFGPAVPAWTTATCGAPHGHLTVAPDGTAYLPPISCLDGRAATAVSEDDGLTWRMSSVPGSVMPGAAGNPSVAVGAGGTAYLAWGGGEDALQPYVAVTRDRGRTWSRPALLARGLEKATFVTAVAGDDDRAAVAFLGSRGEDLWSVWVSVTYDGGRTWRATEASGPVHRGPVCMSGQLCTDSDRVLLDFMDVALGKDGRVLVAAAVSCRDARCSSAATASGETVPVLLRQVSGSPLRRGR